ncbi:MAG: rhomboid family intramembrane serine protease [Acidilobaceae archaeon]|nr:rhomboid family intramembrane serine protease [Acidilobaceae archaeon]
MRSIVNDVLIAVNVSMFLLSVLTPSLLAPGASGPREALLRLSLIPAALLEGERLHTLITSMFLHASLLHLAANMLYLYIFGGPVESSLGHLRYFLLYLLSGIAASFAHAFSLLLFDPQVLRLPAVGASGAVSGVIGAYMAFMVAGRLKEGPTPAVIAFLVLWAAYQLLSSFSAVFGGTQIAFWAHIGGLLAGYALAIVLTPAAPRRPLLPQES